MQYFNTFKLSYLKPIPEHKIQYILCVLVHVTLLRLLCIHVCYYAPNINQCLINVYVVVQFGFWFNFDFTLFFSMLICDNEYQTKENQN